MIPQVFNRKRPQTAIRLCFFIPHVIGFKSGRGLHRSQGKQLHHVVLKHISNNPCLLIVAGTVLNTEGFNGCNTDMVDIPSVPNRFKNRIGKTKHQYVLNGFFGQIVIDSEHLAFLKIRMDTLIKIDGRA